MWKTGFSGHLRTPQLRKPGPRVTAVRTILASVSSSIHLAGAPSHGQGTCHPAHRATSSSRSAADLRDCGRQPEPHCGRRAQDRRLAAGGIDWVHVRHEEAAAFAAAAEAQLTGRLAVCAGSCGPGNLHLINGLYDANRSGAPVLAIASHIPSKQIGSSYFQETHPDRLFNECSVYSRDDQHGRADAAGDAQRHPARRRRSGASPSSRCPATSPASRRPRQRRRRHLPAGARWSRTRPSVRELADAINDAGKVTIFCRSRRGGRARRGHGARRAGQAPRSDTPCGARISSSTTTPSTSA